MSHVHWNDMQASQEQLAVQIPRLSHASNQTATDVFTLKFQEQDPTNYDTYYGTSISSH